MLFQPHDIVTIVTAVIILSLVAVLSMLHIDSDKRWRRLRMARRYLATASAVVGLSGITSIALADESTNPALVSSSTFFVGMIQATIFTYVCVWMVRPEFRSRVPIAANIILSTAVGGAAIAVAALAPQAYQDWRWVWALLFAGQIAAYCRIFLREYRAGATHIDDEYEDDTSYRLRWIRRCFAGALAVGILALVFASIPLDLVLFDCFMAAYTLYYIYISLCVINYRTRGAFIVRVAAVGSAAATPEAADEAKTGTAAAATMTTAELHAVIEKNLARWVEARLYLESDIPMDEIAAYIGVTRRQFSAYFAEAYHMQFRTWRNTKRIEYARTRIEEDPDTAISALPEATGFANASNFYSEFKRQTGMTPSEYRAKHHAEPDV